MSFGSKELTNQRLVPLHISCPGTPKASSSPTNFRVEPSLKSSLANSCRLILVFKRFYILVRKVKIFSSRFLNSTHEWKPDAFVALYRFHVCQPTHTTSTFFVLYHCLQNWHLIKRTRTSGISGNKPGTSDRVMDGTPQKGPHQVVALSFVTAL